MNNNRLLLILLIIFNLGCTTNKPLCLQEINSNRIIHFDASEDFEPNRQDKALYAEIATWFGYLEGDDRPVFLYFNDEDLPVKNAISYRGWSRKSKLSRDFKRYKKSKEGYVLIGKEFAKFLAPVDGETQKLHYAYPFILAHELAHIVQYNIGKRILVSKEKDGPFRPTFNDRDFVQKRLELNADYVAGIFYSVYLKGLLTKITNEKDPIKKDNLLKKRKHILNSVNKFICELGNRSGSANSHGNCKERTEAFNRGRKRFYEDSFVSITDEISNELRNIE